MASSFFGEPRATADIDVAVLLDESLESALIDASEESRIFGQNPCKMWLLAVSSPEIPWSPVSCSRPRPDPWQPDPHECGVISGACLTTRAFGA